MESCEAVEKELDKVLSKFSSTSRHAANNLQELITHIEGIKKGLLETASADKSEEESGQLNPVQRALLEQCIKKVKDTTSKLSTEHKDLHGCVSKVGKAIDKNFVSDFEGVVLQRSCGDKALMDGGGVIGLSLGGGSEVVGGGCRGEEERRKEIDEVVCEHILRHGMLDVAENLETDCGRQLDEGRRDPFIQIHQVHEALKARDIQPALRWAESNSEQLMAQNSCLEFKLHKLHFIELVQRGTSAQWQAIEYAKNFARFADAHTKGARFSRLLIKCKTALKLNNCKNLPTKSLNMFYGQAIEYTKNFARFADAHTKELRVLMGSLLYIRQGLDTSPYSHLLDPIDWEEICDIFTRDACALLGLASESPLSILIKAGCTALPPLLTIKQVMQQRQCSGVWSAKDELPVEIELGLECRFHSVFACPILRQQCSESNPPMRLVCGHVISRDALNKLATVNKVKCPYCPMEQVPTDAQQIFF